MLTLGPDDLRDLSRSATREWLLADGRGGYAASSVLGLNTRRQHGLLVVAGPEGTRPWVLLSKLDETLVTRAGVRHELATNAYPETIHPRGHELAVAFSLDPLPTLVWEAAGSRLTRIVARVQGEPAVVVLYQLEGEPAVLEIRPFVAFREADSLRRESPDVRRDVERQGEDVVLDLEGPWPPIVLRAPGAEWTSDGYWYRNLEYERDRIAGLDYSEDVYSHGVFSLRLEPGRPASILAWAGPIPPVREAGSLASAERKRLRELAAGSDGLIGELRRSASAFLVRRAEGGRGIQLGYHQSHGGVRDALLCVPGVCLATGRLDDARLVLAETARRLERGAVSGDGERDPEAALWLVVTAERYLEATRDHDFIRSRMLPALVGVVETWLAGMVDGPELTPDGLVAWPEGDWRLEPQALWLNALLIVSEMARACGQGAPAEWTTLAARTRTSLLRLFWSEPLGRMAERITAGRPDYALLPSQLLAIGLPHAVVPRDKAVRILAAVKAELVTPTGLREEVGGARVRPDLMGLYFDSLVRVYGEEGKREAREWLRDFTPHLGEAGLGYVSEAFVGDAPAGAIASARAVGELLRIASRLPARPPSSATRA